MKRIVRFTASWCAPCKALATVIESVNTEIPIEVVDIDKQMDMAINASVRSVPTLIMFEGDVEIKRHTGTMDATKLAEWINNG